MNTKYILIGIAVSAVVTFALRALPFVIFNGKRQMPEMLVKLGKVLPATIMAVLIVYCLKGAGNWNTESCRRAGDRRNVQMEAQYAVKYSAGDCELYGYAAHNVDNHFWLIVFSSNLCNRIADNLYAESHY